MNPLEAYKKYRRYLNRATNGSTGAELALAAVSGGLGLMLGTVISLIATHGAGPVLSVVAGSVAASLALGQYFMIRGIHKQNGTSAEINNHTIIGAAMDVGIVANTQDMINAITKKFNYAAQLPPQMQKKLDPYFKDAEEALIRLRVVDGKGNPSASLPLTRPYIDAAGNETEKVIATLGAPSHTATLAPAIKEMLQSASPQQRREIFAALQEEFSEVSAAAQQTKPPSGAVLREDIIVEPFQLKK